MAKKNKTDLDICDENIEKNNESNNKNINEFNNENETSSKIGYRIILKTKTFIIIDKYGINVRINLPMQELVKYKEGDMYYL